MHATLDDAMKVAAHAYAGKKDKAGKPYILHALRVMLAVEDGGEEMMIAALLHDVIEDSGMSYDQLLSLGFGELVAGAVQKVSRANGESYTDFIERIAPDAFAARIKLADLEDNMNLFRLKSMDEGSLRRTRKYHKAWRRLNESLASKANCEK